MRLICQRDPRIDYPGESWLWTGSDGFRVAVDVGAGKADFGLTVAAHEPHVVVLTHDDRDHIGGVNDFLSAMLVAPTPGWHMRHNAASRSPDPLEIWMPYDWVRLLLVLAMAEGVLDGDETAEGFEADNFIQESLLAAHEARPRRSVKGKDGLTRKIGGVTDSEVLRNRKVFGARHDEYLLALGDRQSYNSEFPLDSAGDRTDSDSSAGRSEEASRRARLADMASLDDLMESVEALDLANEDDLIQQVKEAIVKRRGRLKDLFKGARGWTGEPDEMAERAVETAHRTLGLIRTALAAGVTLRFFDPDSALAVSRAFPHADEPWRRAGLPGRVTILNAREVPVRVPKKPKDMPEALALAARLTVQNRRALATFLWPEQDMPWHDRYRGALIWSDTEHGLMGEAPTHRVVPWSLISTMSAPHHASTDEFHIDLWRYRPQHVRVLLSHNIHDDTDRFLTLATSQRDCTKCASQVPTHVVENHPWSHDAALGRCLESHGAPAKKRTVRRQKPASRAR